MFIKLLFRISCGVGSNVCITINMVLLWNLWNYGIISLIIKKTGYMHILTIYWVDFIQPVKYIKNHCK